MKIVYFSHSLRSCWNHGNAHFLRGVLRELIDLGHDVWALEPEHSWSLDNLLAQSGEQGLAAFRRAYPELEPRTYSSLDEIDAALDGADVVIAHEWNHHDLLARLGERRREGRFLLLFHDTHHRAVSAPDEITSMPLDDFDAILAFGAVLADVYDRRGWAGRTHVWHEAADTRLFKPPLEETRRDGLVFVGNWGDDERSRELVDYLFAPAAVCGLDVDVHGVRYPQNALETLATYGAHYRGWIANADAPTVFASHLATVHVPRRFYATILPGIPTIRVFEALACGIPLLSAPWDDAEGLFRPGTDYLVAPSGEAMARLMRDVRGDSDVRASLTNSGLETIRARHTCRHRAEELLSIIAHHRKGCLETVA